MAHIVCDSSRRTLQSGATWIPECRSALWKSACSPPITSFYHTDLFSTRLNAVCMCVCVCLHICTPLRSSAHVLLPVRSPVCVSAQIYLFICGRREVQTAAGTKLVRPNVQPPPPPSPRSRMTLPADLMTLMMSLPVRASSISSISSSSSSSTDHHNKCIPPSHDSPGHSYTTAAPSHRVSLRCAHVSRIRPAEVKH